MVTHNDSLGGGVFAGVLGIGELGGLKGAVNSGDVSTTVCKTPLLAPCLPSSKRAETQRDGVTYFGVVVPSRAGFRMLSPATAYDTVLNIIHQGYPPVNFDAQKPDGSGSRNLHVNVRTTEHTALVREIGSASAVLLKNNRTTTNGSPTGSTIRGLPLDKSRIKTMAVVGQDAKAPNKSCGDLNECNDGTMSIGWVYMQDSALC